MIYTKSFKLDLTGDVQIMINDSQDEAVISITGDPVPVGPILDMRDDFVREGMNEKLASQIAEETIVVVSRRLAMDIFEKHLIK